MTELPYGRGLRRGINARVDQSEAFSEREGRIPVNARGVVSPLDALLNGGVTDINACVATNEVLFLPLRSFSTDIAVSYAYINVSATAAGSSLDTCIYAEYEPTRFVRIPHSQVSFNTANTTGLIESKLSAEVVLKRDRIHLLASVPIGGTPTLVTYHMVGASVGISAVRTTTETTLQDSISWLSLSDSGRFFVPYTAYVSEIVRELV